MKTIYSILFCLLPFLASTQIIFKEINAVGEFVLDVAESAEGRQAIKTTTAWYTKTLSDQNWTVLPIPIDSILDLNYSPDGRLYILKEDAILSSTDNGQNFTVITQLGPFTLYNHIEVLQNDVLFVYDDGLFFTQYSLNNGKDWVNPNLLSLNGGDYSIKMVDDNIIVSGADIYLTTDIIDVTSNNTNNALYEDVNFLYYSLPAIMDDGTIYFTGHDLQVAHIGAMYSFRVDQGLSLVGYFPILDGIFGGFKASGSDLYAFRKSKYYVFNGVSFDQYPMIGLPDESQSRIILTENDFVYMTYADRIFRSTSSLTYEQNISGSVLKDSDSDCIIDIGDKGLKRWQVKVEGDDFMRIKSTDDNGDFTFAVPKGNFTLSTQPINTNWELCQSEAEIVIDEDHPDTTFNFHATALNDCANLEIDFSTPLLRRCFENYYQVHVRNSGPSSSAGTKITLTLDPFFEFISATIPSTEISPGILEMDLGVLEINEEITFKIYFTISCNVAIGQEHCLSGRLVDANLCDLARFYYKECQTNIGSYDPNDKRIFNEAGVEADRVDLGEYIYYHIRFQNTGTDTAFDVRVIDPLSDKLDFSTLEMLSASHPYTYEITDGPDLAVQFENILLPDSATNEPASHGYFKFRIKPRVEFNYGTSIPNQASIYFDFNEAVNTEEVSLTLFPTVHTREISDLLEFEIIPNPAKDRVRLQLSTNDFSGVDSYDIIDHVGRSVINKTFNKEEALSVEQLNAGVYTILLRNDRVILAAGRFIKI